ncbi:PilW family protein [Marinobacter sediminicola]|uniref:PilW family protein n=1 Tax=Marinobacter sediminicola TaxID=3072994 RepID=UPI0028128BFA|nr:PilW family protein [Marinobacter sp. F26243]
MSKSKCDTAALGSNMIKPQSGLSLVELMIALALSATLILGIFTVYMDSSKTTRVGESLARVQESGRIGLEIMSREVRMAGYQGCSDSYTVPLNVVANNPPPSLTPASAGDGVYFYNSGLMGWQVTTATQTSWDAGTDFENIGVIEDDALPGSDVLMVQRARPLTATIKTVGMTNTGGQIPVDDPDGLFGASAAFSSGSLLMIASCEFADVFRLTNNPSGANKALAHAATANASNDLSVAYAGDEDAEIYALESTVFFVADTGRVDDQGNSISALYRARNNFPNSATPSFQREELVEGVEALKVQYGLRTNASSNTIQYVDASGVSAADWKNVVVVRVGMLVSASGNVLEQNDSQAYELPGTVFVANNPSAGQQVHAADRRLRKAFVSTLDIRNRRCGEFKQFGTTNQWEWETANNNGGDGDPCN